MKKPVNLSVLLVGLYSWLVMVSFGVVLLDVVYAGLLRDDVSFDPSSVFGEISDFMLLIGGVTLLSGILAVSVSSESKSAQSFLVASLLVVVLEFIVPLFLFKYIGDALEGSGFPFGTAIKLFGSGLASILAILGLIRFLRSQ